MGSPSFRIDAQDYMIATWTMSLADQGRLILAACEAVCAADRSFFNESVPYFHHPVYFKHNPMYISLPVRRAVYDRDGRRCKHCASPNHLSIDHIFPRSKGGGDEIENLQTLCMPCNRRKGVN